MWRWLLLAPLLVVLILFTLSNTEPVDLRLWPFDLAWQAPLALAVLTGAALAFLVGALIAWLSGMPWRSRARNAERQLARLQGEMAALKAAEEKRNAALSLPPAA
ncbi:LapA family protein [Acetobacteraceae bacterium H6797]|nr:LapA family protein [Acetobacteraceae bacterium H6797]